MPVYGRWDRCAQRRAADAKDAAALKSHEFQERKRARHAEIVVEEQEKKEKEESLHPTLQLLFDHGYVAELVTRMVTVAPCCAS